ncbi:MAG: IS21 family transposase, partial [Oxalobacteraceae bacterium]
VREAVLAGITSDDVILNILARRREPPRPLAIAAPENLALHHPPRADRGCYDSLRGFHAAA